MSLSAIIDKMSSRDKDFRYMATSDLLTELQKDAFKMDNESERKLCQMIIKLLSDGAGDVQGLAVKWCARRARGRSRTAAAPYSRPLLSRATHRPLRTPRRPRARRLRAACRCSCARCRPRRWRRSWTGSSRW